MLIGLVLYFIFFLVLYFQLIIINTDYLDMELKPNSFFPFDLHHIPCSAIKDRLLILLVGELKQCHRLYIGFF